MFQQIVAYVILGMAIAFLLRKFFWKKKSKKNCGPDDCDCH